MDSRVDSEEIVNGMINERMNDTCNSRGAVVPHYWMEHQEFVAISEAAKQQNAA